MYGIVCGTESGDLLSLPRRLVRPLSATHSQTHQSSTVTRHRGISTTITSTSHLHARLTAVTLSIHLIATSLCCSCCQRILCRALVRSTTQQPCV